MTIDRQAQVRVEAAVVGSMIISPDAIASVLSAGVAVRHFEIVAHQVVFTAVVDLFEQLEPVDIVSVCAQIGDDLPNVGGPEGVSRLFDTIPTAANVDHYVKRLLASYDVRVRRSAVARAAELLAEGRVEEAEAALDSAKPGPARAQTGRRLVAEAFWDVTADVSKPPLVDQVVGYAETGIIYGASGAGKSFFASDLAFHVAMGWPWHGRSVSRGAVVYVAAEAAGSMRLRFLALAKRYDHLRGRPVPLKLVPESVNLLKDEADVDALITLCQEPVDGVPVSVLILDTLASTIPGGDENDFQSMSLFTSRMDRIKRETGATVVAVHHSGKDQARGARGHSSLKGNVDFMIEVTREDDLRFARVEKVRDGEDGQRFGFELVPVEVGLAFDGKPKLVPVVNHLSPDETRKPPEGRARDALHVLTKLLVARPGGVALEDWRNAFVESFSGELKPKAARDTHQRCVRQLAPWVAERDGLFKTRVAPRPATGQNLSLIDQSVRATPSYTELHEKAPTGNLPCSSVKGGTPLPEASPELHAANQPPEPNAALLQPSYKQPCSSAAEAPSYTATTPFRRGCSAVAPPPDDEDEREAQARVDSLKPSPTPGKGGVPGPDAPLPLPAVTLYRQGPGNGLNVQKEEEATTAQESAASFDFLFDKFT